MTGKEVRILAVGLVIGLLATTIGLLARDDPQQLVVGAEDTGAAIVTPEPTEIPSTAEPTAAPTAGATSAPVPTAIPTATTEPTPRPTVEPTTDPSTPVPPPTTPPVATPTVAFTPTAVPTSTVAPLATATPAPTATSTVPTATAFPTSIPDFGIPEQLLQPAIAALAATFDVDPGQVVVLNVTQTNFSTPQLGCGDPGSVSVQVITPGYTVIMAIAGLQFDFRVNSRTGFFFQCS